MLCGFTVCREDNSLTRGAKKNKKETHSRASLLSCSIGHRLHRLLHSLLLLPFLQKLMYSLLHLRAILICHHHLFIRLEV